MDFFFFLTGFVDIFIIFLTEIRYVSPRIIKRIVLGLLDVLDLIIAIFYLI